MNNFILQQVYERRWLLGVTSIVLMLFSVFVVSLYPVLSQLQPSNPIIENMPVLFEGFLGELSYLREFPTFLASQLLTIHLPLWLGVVAVIYGWSVSGAAENRGEFRAILARPMSRTMLVLNKWIVLIAMVTICTAVIGIGVYLALPVIEGDTTIGLSMYMLLMLLMWLYACTLSTLTYAVGIVTVRRWITVPLSVAFVAIGYYITIFNASVALGKSADWLSLLEKVAAVEVVQYGVSLLQLVAFGSITGGALIIAIVALNVRDITR